MCVIITGRHEEALRETAGHNDNIVCVVADHAKSEDNGHVVDVARQESGRLDVFVNCAGWCPVKDLKHITGEDYDHAIVLDTRAAVDLTVLSLPLLLESKSSIINISSVGAAHPGPNLSMYAGAKAAAEAFTKSWGVKLAEDGVRVNAIAPGGSQSSSSGMHAILRIFWRHCLICRKGSLLLCRHLRHPTTPITSCL